MKIKYVKPIKLKVLTLVFFAVGIWGISFGLSMPYIGYTPTISMTITVLGVVNLSMGGFVGYLLLTQVKTPDSRKSSKYKREK